MSARHFSETYIFPGTQSPNTDRNDPQADDFERLAQLDPARAQEQRYEALRADAQQMLAAMDETTKREYGLSAKFLNKSVAFEEGVQNFAAKQGQKSRAKSADKGRSSRSTETRAFAREKLISSGIPAAIGGVALFGAATGGLGLVASGAFLAARTLKRTSAGAYQAENRLKEGRNIGDKIVVGPDATRLQRMGVGLSNAASAPERFVSKKVIGKNEKRGGRRVLGLTLGALALPGVLKGAAHLGDLMTGTARATNESGGSAANAQDETLDRAVSPESAETNDKAAQTLDRAVSPESAETKDKGSHTLDRSASAESGGASSAAATPEASESATVTREKLISAYEDKKEAITENMVYTPETKEEMLANLEKTKESIESGKVTNLEDLNKLLDNLDKDASTVSPTPPAGSAIDADYNRFESHSGNRMASSVDFDWENASAEERDAKVRETMSNRPSLLASAMEIRQDGNLAASEADINERTEAYSVAGQNGELSERGQEARRIFEKSWDNGKTAELMSDNEVSDLQSRYMLENHQTSEGEFKNAIDDKVSIAANLNYRPELGDQLMIKELGNGRHIIVKVNFEDPTRHCNNIMTLAEKPVSVPETSSPNVPTGSTFSPETGTIIEDQPQSENTPLRERTTETVTPGETPTTTTTPEDDNPPPRPGKKPEEDINVNPNLKPGIGMGDDPLVPPGPITNPTPPPPVYEAPEAPTPPATPRPVPPVPEVPAPTPTTPGGTTTNPF